MKRRKKIASLLLITTMMQIMPTNLLANAQSQVTDLEVKGRNISHSFDGEEMRPEVAIVWEKPDALGDGGISGDHLDWGAKHDLEFYQVVLKINGEDEIYRSEHISKDALEANLGDPHFVFYKHEASNDKYEEIGDIYQLENGKLYNIEVDPVHRHLIENIDGFNSEEDYEIAPEGGAPATTINIITDFDTKVEQVSEGLVVSWEYIPGANYTLNYAQGAKVTKGEIIEDDFHKEIIVTADEAKKSERDGRVEYVIEGLTARERYSMFVEFHSFAEGFEGIKGVITNNNIDESGPKVVNEMTPITLTVTSVGGNQIEIYWGNVAESATTAVEGGLVNVEIEAKPKNAPDSAYELIARVYTEESFRLESAVLEAPDVDTCYRVIFKFDGSAYEDAISEEGCYMIPTKTEPPYAPQVPQPFGPYVDRETSDKDDYEDYLVEGDTRTLVEGDENEVTYLEFEENTFHGALDNDGNPNIQLVWDAPKTKDDELEVDYDLSYDIWVTDDYETIIDDMGTMLPVIENQFIYETNGSQLITHKDNVNEVLGMKLDVDTYVDHETFITQPLKTNKTYYLKIVAKRITEESASMENPQYVVSEPTIVAVTIDKDGHIYPPPVVGKPPLQIDEESITTNSMTIEWLTDWWEVLAKNPLQYTGDEKILAEYGSSVVYTQPHVSTITTGPAIRFDYIEDYETYYLYDTETTNGSNELERLEEVLETIEAGYFDTHYIAKRVVLHDVAYEAEVLTYDEVEQMMGERYTIEEWVKEVASDDERSNLQWEDISPYSEEGDEWLKHDVTKINGKPLESNTRYVILLRAYRIVDGERVYQSFPAYVIGTTLSDFEGPEAVPTTPLLQLEEESETDSSFKVYWEYNDDFRYELIYSTEDYTETAIPFEFVIVDTPEEEDRANHHYYFINGENATITINGLFPNTAYNVWIKAYQKEGVLSSVYSSPVTGVTTDLAIPDIPKGLGVASEKSIEEAGESFEPVGEDYLAVEWTKDNNDQGEQTLGSLNKWYEYDVEFSDNVEFEGSTVVTVTEALGSQENATFIAKNLVRWDALINNRPYYIRVRTRVTVESNDGDEIIEKESEYCTWIRVTTNRSDNEYDGNEDNVVVFDETYEEDYSGGDWTLEIVDAQTAITDIIESDAYYYTIDMTLYDNRRDAVTRNVLIPVSVMQALIGQRMGLEVNTLLGNYKIPADSLNYSLDKAKATDKMHIELETILAYDIKDYGKAYPYVLEVAERMRVYVKTEARGTEEISYFDEPIQVSLKLEDQGSYLDNNYKTFTYEPSKGSWTEYGHSVSAQSDNTYLTYRQNRTGIYTAYKIDTYYDVDEINYAIQQLLAQYNILKLGTHYKEDDRVHSKQYVNLVLNIAKGNRDIDLDSTISESIENQARLSKIYTEDFTDYITEEQAISGIVRLYEMKTGYQVKPANISFSGVSSQYRESIAKAYAIGLINDINPQSQVDYGQLCTWIQMVIPY